jgi:hypothetical protein
VSKGFGTVESGRNAVDTALLGDQHAGFLEIDTVSPTLKIKDSTTG